MNNRVLKKQKIDQQYVLSEKKFLYTFGYLCLGSELIDKRSWKKKDLQYLLQRNLIQVPEEMVTYENIARGEIILVGRPNSFRAYLRPKEKREEIKLSMPEVNTKEEKSEETKERTVNDYSLTELLNAYRNNFDNEKSQVYLEELMNRLRVLDRGKDTLETGYVKTYHKRVLTKDKKVIK